MDDLRRLKDFERIETSRFPPRGSEGHTAIGQVGPLFIWLPIDAPYQGRETGYAVLRLGFLKHSTMGVPRQVEEMELLGSECAL